MNNAVRYILVCFALASCTGFQSRYYRVQGGETWSSIASKFDVPLVSLKESNESSVSRGLKPGVKVYIPFEENPHWNLPSTRQVASQASHEDASEEPPVDTHGHNSGPVLRTSLESPLVRYVWPIRGRVSSYFGKRHGNFHEGIDIVAPQGTNIQASRSGHVIYAGNKISGYGNLVIIKHSDAYATVYAHLSKIQVAQGQFVAKGTKIGKVGMTGHATSPHLHFEVRKGQTPTNPMQFLSGQVLARNTRR